MRMIEHRAELRSKIEKRQQQLTAALKGAESKSLPETHVQALGNELRVSQDALTGGWEKMSEVTAAQLTRWLEQTNNLVAGEVNPANKAATIDHARVAVIKKTPEGIGEGIGRNNEHDAKAPV